MQQYQKTFLPWFQEQVRLDGRVGGQREASVQVLFRKKSLVSVLLVGEDVGGGRRKRPASEVDASTEEDTVDLE